MGEFTTTISMQIMLSLAKEGLCLYGVPTVYKGMNSTSQSTMGGMPDLLIITCFVCMCVGE